MDKKGVVVWITVGIVALCIALFILMHRSAPSEEVDIPIESGFCGDSTFGTCQTNEECTPKGCSSQVCAGITEEVFSTCDIRECYNPEVYNVACQCINNECQWN